MNVKDNLDIVGNMIFTSVILGVIAFALVQSTYWPYEARILPQIIGVPAIAMCVAILGRDCWRLWRPSESRPTGMTMDIQADRDMPLPILARRATLMFGWVLVFFAVTWALGFLISVPLFVFVYLVLQGREPLWIAVVGAVSMFLFAVVVFHFVLHVAWLRGAYAVPQQILIEWLNKLY